MLWVLPAFHALNLTVRRIGILNHNPIHPELIRGSLAGYFARRKSIAVFLPFLPRLLTANEQEPDFHL
jgi:hypothetical protein